MRSKTTAVLLFVFTLFTTLSNAQVKKWTLNECVAYALEHNISIKQSELDEQTAKVGRSDAIAAFLPTANTQANHSWNIGLNQNITTGLLQNQTTQFTSLGVSMGVDIYKGLQNQNRARKANLSIIAAQYQATKMREDIALNIANAYLQVLFNKENLKVQQEQLSFDEQQKQRITDLVDGGVVPRGDLLDIEATVATDKQNIIGAENTLLISKLSLAQLLQLEDFQDFDIAESEYEVTESNVMLQSPDAIYNKAKTERTEIKIAEVNLAVAEKDVKIARGAYQPTLRGFYSFDTRASYADQIVGLVPDTNNPTSVIGFLNGDPDMPVLQPNFKSVLGGPDPVLDQFDRNKGHSFGFSLSIPIFNGFSVRNNVQRAKIERERAELKLEQGKLDLERDVYTAYTDAMGALKAYEAALSAAEARELSLEYATERYNAGLINVLDFNQAKTLSANAQSEVLRTKYDYIFRVKILEFYFGIPIIQQQ